MTYWYIRIWIQISDNLSLPYFYP